MKVAPPIRFAGSTLTARAHICTFLNSPDEAHRVLLPFVKEALELSEKALRTVRPSDLVRMAARLSLTPPQKG